MVRVILSALTTLTLVGVFVSAAPVNKDVDANLKVVSQLIEYGRDEFSWRYELSDEREVSQYATRWKLDDGTSVLQFDGSYIYDGPDGITYSVSYIADEKGYHPYVLFGGSRMKPQAVDTKVLASLVG